MLKQCQFRAGIGSFFVSKLLVQTMVGKSVLFKIDGKLFVFFWKCWLAITFFKVKWKSEGTILKKNLSDGIFTGQQHAFSYIVNILEEESVYNGDYIILMIFWKLCIVVSAFTHAPWEARKPYTESYVFCNGILSSLR